MENSRILVVDDEANIRMMVERMLDPLEHEVQMAENGRDAYEQLCNGKFDLVISDLNMPEMNGLTLLKKIREDGMDTAFIILTGNSDLPQALSAREQYNISNFLVKPIHNIDQFLFDVEAALSRRRLEIENLRLMSELKNTNADLEEKVRLRTRELEENNAKLVQLSNFRADVLKVLGHELRTPLAILKGYIHLIDNKSADFDDFHGQIGKSVERLMAIVEKTLQQMKHSGESEFHLDLETVDAGVLCRSVVDRLTPFLEVRGIEVECRVAENLPKCRWDCDKVEVLLEELLTNAVRASEDKTLVRVEAEMTPEEGQIAIRVTDWGQGVPQAECERIFEPFVILGSPDHHTSGMFDRHAQGIGIGLSTARMWAGLHQGRLDCRPNPEGAGTVFTCLLPVEARQEPRGE